MPNSTTHHLPMKLITALLVLAGTATTITAAPTEPIVNSQVLPRQAWPPGYLCGKCRLTGSGELREMRTSEPTNKCQTMPDGEQLETCSNLYCGLCVIFK